MFIKPIKSIPLETIQHPIFTQKNLILQILRLDKTDAIISGNKWFKLKYNLLEAKKQKHHTIVSFGGAYSNHLHALASAGKQYGFNTIGIIRGEEYLPLNSSLYDMTQQGMKLYYINRKTYRKKHLPEFHDYLTQLITKDDPFCMASLAHNFYLMPEGGTNNLALLGASEIVSYLPYDSHYICVPCGTGGTIAGLIHGLNQSQHDAPEKAPPKVLGFAAMKGGQFLEDCIQQLLSQQDNHSEYSLLKTTWELFYDWHFGGFAKINPELTKFINDFEKKYKIELDPVYTAKMMYAIVSLAKENYFPPKSHIIVVHTGGLQGKRGMEKKYQTLLSHSENTINSANKHNKGGIK